MKRIPPSVQVQQALTASLQAWFAGHPLRQFVARAAELMLQIDGDIWSFARTLTAGVLTETRLTNLRGHVTTYRFNTRGYLIGGQQRPLFAQGEEVERVRVAATLGGPSQVTYITTPGREVAAVPVGAVWTPEPGA